MKTFLFHESKLEPRICICGVDGQRFANRENRGGLVERIHKARYPPFCKPASGIVRPEVDCPSTSRDGETEKGIARDARNFKRPYVCDLCTAGESRPGRRIH